MVDRRYCKNPFFVGRSERKLLLRFVFCWTLKGFKLSFGCLQLAKDTVLGPVHTNPFSNENGAVLLRFQKICVHTYRLRIVFARPHYNAVSVWKRCYTLSAHGQMDSTHAHFNISAREIGPILKPHGGICPPFWIVTVEWSGARSCLFWWRHRFQIASFSPSILEKAFSKSIVFKSLHSGERFRMAPFSVIVFGVVVWTIAVSGAKQLRFRLKTD